MSLSILLMSFSIFFFFSSRRRHTRSDRDWSSDVCSSDLTSEPWLAPRRVHECWVLGRFSPKAGTPPARIGELAQFRGWTRALMLRRLKALARASLPLLYRHYVRRTTREQPGGA